MHHKSKEDIEKVPSNPKQNNNLVLRAKTQEVFSISSPSFNFPSKKPCMLNCSHHPNSHFDEKPPLPPRQKECDKVVNISSSADFIEKKIKIVRDISQRKSEIWLNEQQRTIPSLTKLNEFYEKETRTKNEHNSTSKYNEKCQCHNNNDTNRQDVQNNLKVNSISCLESPLYHFKPNKNFPFQRPTKLDFEKSNHLWRENILFHEPEVYKSNNCDMFKVIDKLKLKLNRIIKKKLLFICVIAILFFLIGLVFQFYRNCGKGTDLEAKADPSNLKGMSGFYVKKALESNSKDILSELFISVKTTKKYHYPRVIVQLETWASLVKEQVMYICGTTWEDELKKYLIQTV